MYSDEPYLDDDEDQFNQTATAQAAILDGQAGPGSTATFVPPRVKPVNPYEQQLGTGSFLDNPDFQSLQKMFPQSGADEQSRRQQLRDDAMESAMFNDQASILLGHAPSAQVETRKLFDQNELGQLNQKMQRYKDLLDMYKNAQGAQDLGEQRRLKTFNAWADNSPMSEKSKTRQNQFKNNLDSYEAAIRVNAKQMGLSPDEANSLLSSLSGYRKNADKMSYAEMQKAEEEIQKMSGNQTQIGRNASMAAASGVNAELAAKRLDEEAKQHGFKNALDWQEFKLKEAKLKFDQENKNLPFEHREADKREERQVEDFDFVKGRLPTADDKKKVSTSKESLDQMLYNINLIQDHVKENGVSAQSLFGSGEQLSRIYENLALQAKELFKLGVLNGNDYKLITTILPDPASMKTWAKEKWGEFVGQDGSNYLTNLNLVKKTLLESVARSARAHNYDDSKFREKYGIAQKQPATSKKDKDIANWANKYFNGDYDKAKKYLMKRGDIPRE